MLAAADKAKNSKSSDDRSDLTLYLFFFATTVLHEIGHLFVTYLSQGKEDTPINVGPRDAFPEGEEERGEAGYNLEHRLFGGKLIWARHPDREDNDSQVCLCMVALGQNQSIGVQADT